MTISHQGCSNKTPQTYVVMAYLDHLFNKTALKLKHQNAEIN